MAFDGNKNQRLEARCVDTNVMSFMFVVSFMFVAQGKCAVPKGSEVPRRFYNEESKRTIFLASIGEQIILTPYVQTKTKPQLAIVL